MKLKHEGSPPDHIWHSWKLAQNPLDNSPFQGITKITKAYKKACIADQNQHSRSGISIRTLPFFSDTTLQGCHEPFLGTIVNLFSNSGRQWVGCGHMSDLYRLVARIMIVVVSMISSYVLYILHYSTGIVPLYGSFWLLYHSI